MKLLSHVLNLAIVLLPLVSAGTLTVKLVRLTNLRDVDGIGKSDPYVKLQVKQDNWLFDRRYGRHVSSKKTNDLSPEFQEVFTFDDLPSLKNMVLQVRVKDDDVGIDDAIGACDIKLHSFWMKWKLGQGEPIEKRCIVDQKKALTNFFSKLPGSMLFRRKAKAHFELTFSE